MATTADVIRRFIECFAARDRATAEALLAEDLAFSSPRDDRISKAEYFARCWPNADKIRDFRIEQLFEQGEEAFLRYTAERVADGVRFRNTEYFRVHDGRIREIDVYFGRDLATRR
jgi:ketosteroid isomerase-like protein